MRASFGVSACAALLSAAGERRGRLSVVARLFGRMKAVAETVGEARSAASHALAGVDATGSGRALTDGRRRRRRVRRRGAGGAGLSACDDGGKRATAGSIMMGPTHPTYLTAAAQRPLSAAPGRP